MAYKKRTLRTMSPTARKVARLVGEQESVAKRLKNLVPDLQRLDLDSKALANAKEKGLLQPYIPDWLDALLNEMYQALKQASSEQGDWRGVVDLALTKAKIELNKD